MNKDIINPNSRETQRARRDVCFISEIINDLKKRVPHGGDFKYSEMLADWQSELMEEAGFETIEEVQAYHAKTVGAENW